MAGYYGVQATDPRVVAKKLDICVAPCHTMTIGK